MIALLVTFLPWARTIGARIWNGLGWRGLLAALAVVMLVIWHLRAIAAAREAGAQGIRLEWAEANRKAELLALQRQREQQEKINEAERELVEARAANAARQGELAAALAEERKAHAKAGADGRCGGMSERVRSALNAIR
ncbi:secretion protein HylD [Rhizobium paknamense]|uniref:Multidrug efflux pump subunit AcrA (Membrane-fusion protein) n=1 Tax=Rhizobium paknamense TaxID=1206817 RepID=A0ABU0ICT8_9HYPH|nr:secretion protein HylD [Rhizobium paknamense]MDQ0456059.1 multidrug efflux pump subunit AcrA (membrane-fusion protein) [Rhizobium paknamense]